jgi:hypothetical protein
LWIKGVSGNVRFCPEKQNAQANSLRHIECSLLLENARFCMMFSTRSFGLKMDKPAVRKGLADYSGADSMRDPCMDQPSKQGATNGGCSWHPIDTETIPLAGQGCVSRCVSVGGFHRDNPLG